MRRRDPQDDAEDFRDDAPPGLFLSRRGNWFHDGQRVGHERLEALLTSAVARDPGGGLIVTTGRDTLPFVAEDAPCFVVAVAVDGAVDGDGDGVGGAVVVLNDGSREALDDVVVGADHRWRMRVKGGKFWALFLRAAAQTLEAVLDDVDGTIVIGATKKTLTTTQRTTWSD
jgi:hypothetical protein